MERGKEIREMRILDHHYFEITNEDEDQTKIKNKISLGIKKKLRKTCTFHCITRHIGKKDRDGSKRMHAVGENNQIFKTCVYREQMEREIIMCNKKHLKHAYSSIIYEDKMYDKLRDNVN